MTEHRYSRCRCHLGSWISRPCRHWKRCLLQRRSCFDLCRSRRPSICRVDSRSFLLREQRSSRCCSLFGLIVVLLKFRREGQGVSFSSGSNSISQHSPANRHRPTSIVNRLLKTAGNLTSKLSPPISFSHQKPARMSNDAAAINELHAAFKLQSAAFLKDQSPSLETRQGYLAKIAGMVSTPLPILL